MRFLPDRAMMIVPPQSRQFSIAGSALLGTGVVVYVIETVQATQGQASADVLLTVGLSAAVGVIVLAVGTFWGWAMWRAARPYVENADTVTRVPVGVVWRWIVFAAAYLGMLVLFAIFSLTGGRYNIAPYVLIATGAHNLVLAYGYIGAERRHSLLYYTTGFFTWRVVGIPAARVRRGAEA
jgi:hypothetical protein